VDDVTAAAIGNPGMSSWAALLDRARFVPGENVLINGATGVSGRLAIQIAKHLGAAKVIVTGRNARSVDGLAALGADIMIPLDAPADELRVAGFISRSPAYAQGQRGARLSVGALGRVFAASRGRAWQSLGRAVNSQRSNWFADRQ
jgi:threonine dehydrogenase-like Zn-dependent dehydrogenase